MVAVFVVFLIVSDGSISDTNITKPQLLNFTSTKIPPDETRHRYKKIFPPRRQTWNRPCLNQLNPIILPLCHSGDLNHSHSRKVSRYSVLFVRHKGDMVAQLKPHFGRNEARSNFPHVPVSFFELPTATSPSTKTSVNWTERYLKRCWVEIAGTVMQHHPTEQCQSGLHCCTSRPGWDFLCTRELKYFMQRLWFLNASEFVGSSVSKTLPFQACQLGGIPTQLSVSVWHWSTHEFLIARAVVMQLRRLPCLQGWSIWKLERNSFCWCLQLWDIPRSTPKGNKKWLESVLLILFVAKASQTHENVAKNHLLQCLDLAFSGS